jgi:cardiolipin synthase
MREALLTTIYAARSELTMTTPYFVPDEATLAALTAAARRGVKVTIVLPKVSDSRLVAAASRSHFEDLLESGVTIMRYRHGLLHAKLLAVDGKFSMIGSANIDARSFWLNFEVTLFVYDAVFTASLMDLQRTYIAGADAVRPEAWRRRGRLERGLENVARLFGPIL